MTRNQALQALAQVALEAVAHVGYANYAHREAEANKWIREKLDELMIQPKKSKD